MLKCIFIGTHHTNPTETYWSNLQSSQATAPSLYSSNQPHTQQPQQQTVMPPVINGSVVSPSSSYIQSYQPNNSFSNNTYGHALTGGKRQQLGETWYPTDNSTSYNGQVYSQKSTSGSSRQNFPSPMSKN